MSWCGSLWVQLVWDSLCFLDLYVIPFTKLWTFSFITFSNKFSITWSFSSPSGITMIRMLVCLKLSQRLLNLSSFFGFFFLLVVLIGCFLLPYVWNHWFDSVSSTLLLFPCKLFFISISESFVSDWVFFYAAEVLTLSILITSVFNSVSDRLLMSILFSSFSGVLICSFIWAMFLHLFILAASLCLFCLLYTSDAADDPEIV